jgi:hypothetical protein
MLQKRSPPAPEYAGGGAMTKTEAILLAWMVTSLLVVIMLLR